MFVILSRLKKKGKYSLVFFLWICYDSYEKKDKTFKTKVREPMQMDLTRGGITRPMLLFAGPMIAGNLLQQCYNIADTLIVGRALGASALASVGFSFTLMTFLTSVLLGVCFTFLYNYFACLLRSVGNSVAPMAFLAVSTVLNIGLDLWFVLGLGWGVAGAAGATVLAQGVSAAGIALYGWRRVPLLRLERRHCKVSRGELGRIMNYSLLTCVQQSVMNFGILMVQGLVNSFGVNVMAAFAAAVKIDAFAYLPVQDFGNAFSTFVAQNTGAQKTERIRRGIRSAVGVSIGFCLVSSLLVCLFAAPLMGLFVEPGETEIIAVGVEYLRIEGMCYCGIGILFLLYGLFRGLGRPGVSVVLTVVSLGTRVALAYLLAPIPAVGLKGIWWAVPIGWVLADLAGLVLWRRGESGGEAGPHAKCQSAERL
ncbi:MATE efflux family protein [Flavonifractor plautii ATCC 29863]|uniref:Probable multidrug resistance protein NorM n=2 Tax=Flavonifractor plautii TaxID=292800 RepID=G9YNU1_FLAPL|nr:MATE efflux family protein [Flavonifractor plautii ATCC 29863]